MKMDNNITTKLAYTANLTNTINGGMSMHQSEITTFDDYYLLRLKIAGVDPDDLKVEVNNRHLLIFQLISISEEERFPHLVSITQIPSKVNPEDISADYFEDELHVTLPRQKDDYHRDIDIMR